MALDIKFRAEGVGHTGTHDARFALVALLVLARPARQPISRRRQGKAAVVMGAPLVVRGTQFVPNEQVTVTVAAAQKRVKRTVAGGRGCPPIPDVV